MAFTGSVQAILKWALTGGSGIAAVAVAGQPVDTLLTSYTDGTGDGKALGYYATSGTITSGSNLDIDLSGVLTNAFGASVVMAKIKAILIRNKATTTAYNLLMGGSATNPVSTILGGTTPSLKIGPKGMALLNNPLDGHVVTAGTADILRLTASGGNIDYELVIFYE